MDFDLDDPLGDLLSDGSNDSFFGTTKKPTETKKASAQPSTDVKSKAKVANLFGFDDEKTINPAESASKSNIDLNIKSQSNSQSLEPKKTPNKEESASNRQSIKPSTPSRSSIPPSATEASSRGSEVVTRTIESDRITNEPVRSVKKDTRFDDSDDFLNELGFDPKHPKGNVGKKSNILDDILNFSKPDPTPKATSMPSAPKPITSEPDKRNSRPLESNPVTNRYSPSLGRPRNTRSGSNSTADPLGLFSTPTKKAQEVTKDESSTAAAKPKASKKATVDWLGLDDGNDENQIETIPIVSGPVRARAESPKPQNTASVVVSAPKPLTTESIPIIQPTMMTATIPTTATDITANLNLITMASLEKEQALQSLQQQQTQLRLAAQMKQQENMLHDMHFKQQTLIKQQENQFNDLLQRQISRQSQLETHIQQQQDQINAYINVLMNQPSIGLASTRIDSDYHSESRPNEEIDSSRQHVIELEADVKRLELDKLRLEDTLQSIQTSHEQELELLQTSHK